jgi:sugar/nucleoside kinase (ribokinase family)
MDNNLKIGLLNKLNKIDKKKLKDFNVVLMPDFFIDHFLTLDDFNIESNKICKIYKQGGGNIPGVTQSLKNGGNAANTALALSRLGISSHLICRTDELGINLLQYFLGNFGVDLSGVKTDGEIAITTAMEFGDEHVNVMLGKTGSVSNFTFEDLDENDLQLISNSDITCVVNWSLNDKGTELAKKVFNYAKKFNIKTFFDTGDPTHRKNEIPDLIKNVITNKNLDILGLNEGELMHYCNLDNDYISKNFEKALVVMKEHVSARIDFHTKKFSYSINNKITKTPTIKTSRILRTTGAGDSWNAGNLFADLLGFNDNERLLFANSVAGFYISSIDSVYPNLEDIKNFIVLNNI